MKCLDMPAGRHSTVGLRVPKGYARLCILVALLLGCLAVVAASMAINRDALRSHTIENGEHCLVTVFPDAMLQLVNTPGGEYSDRSTNILSTVASTHKSHSDSGNLLWTLGWRYLGQHEGGDMYHVSLSYWDGATYQERNKDVLYTDEPIVLWEERDITLRIYPSRYRDIYDIDPP